MDGKSHHVWFSHNLESWHEIAELTVAYPQPGHCEGLDDGKPVAPRFYRLSVE